MKKIFAMLAAIFFCGAMMISCNKDNKEENPTFPTKADMVGTWEGTFTGTATLGKASENYTIKWTLVLNPEGSSTVGFDFVAQRLVGRTTVVVLNNVSLD